MIGSLGDAEFTASEGLVRTFSGLTFSQKASYAGHKIIGRNELLEFTGHDASSCSLDISLDASHGLEPADELEKLSRMIDRHEAVPFILGGNVMGRGLWVIESMNINVADVGSDGYIFSAKASLSLKEYMHEAV